jgi:DNA-binding HxlR family transcriptional regulator
MSDFNYTKLDALLHSRIRLAAVSALVCVDEMEFTQLRDAIGTTDGNLNTHLAKLEQAGYVAVHKFFLGRKPTTSYSVTELGRERLKAYVTALEQFIR